MKYINEIKGLSEKEVHESEKKYGKNILKKHKKPSLIKLFILEFKDPMIIILIFSGVISFFLKEFIDGSVIFFVIFLNALISVIQEKKAYKSLESMHKLSSPKCFVKRDNEIREITSEEIVKGDIVILNEGMVVPADIKLIEVNNLEVDESSLTGESLPIAKQIEDDENDYSKKNYVYSSTVVIKGQGIGQVIKIAHETEIGKINKEISSKKEKTPLEKRLDKLGFQLGTLTIIICLIMFVLSLIKGGDLLEVFISSISLGVAAIPEGLPTVVTIVLSFGVIRMVNKKTIVSNLSSVETLGSINVLCTDKTGTLTQNKMEVKEYYNFSDKIKDEELLYTYLCMSNSVYVSPTEKALKEFIINKKNNIDEEVKKYSLVEEVPFSSDIKYMMMKYNINHNLVSIYKGAVEIILKKCSFYSLSFTRIDEGKRKEIDKYVLNKTNEGYRLIATCVEIGGRTTIINIIALHDPLRKEAKESIAKLKDASIEVKMITGDHKNTAFQIGKEIGICSSIDEVIEGNQIDNMSEEEFLKIIPNISIFARVTPIHKMKIVTGYQKLNKIVAMTGDGINDAPSLKKANVGIAMGESGKEVAKEAADLIIQDDNLYTIVNAVEEGRGIYFNIRKTVLFLLSSNMAEVLVMILSVLLNLPLPLMAIQILFVNLISDSLPALSLGVDKIDKELMKMPPRLSKDNLFSESSKRDLIFYALLLFVLTMISYIFPALINISNVSNFNEFINEFFVLINNKSILAKCRTFALATLSISELFLMIAMSSSSLSVLKIFKNKNVLLILTFFGGIILQISICNIPFLNIIFKTVALNYLEWLFILLISGFVFVAHEVKRLK